MVKSSHAREANDPGAIGRPGIGGSPGWAISERGQSRSRTPLRVDGELLPQGQLHDGVLLAAPKEREQASKGGDREGSQRVYGGLDSGRVPRVDEG
jgi:hypothetical protein